ncbi:MAG TPA: M4 family metallopeptidase [Bacteroidia bacterium]|jgi:Zn-dependent metalloprotease|nr:M4 family metallopeptidase [Bacteroidia bacterium]
MKKTQLLIVASTVICSASFAQTFFGKEAENKIQDAKHIEYSPELSRPKFVEFKSSSANFRMAAGNPLEAMKEILALTENENLVSYKQEKDREGFTHTRYHQLYKDIPVEGGEYIAHQKGGLLDCINGEFFTIGELSVIPSLSESEALSKALSFVGAKKYKWENKQEIENLRAIFEDPNFNYDPKGELVIYPKNNEISDKASFRLAYKFNIYAEDPESRANIFVDAKTGEIIGRHELIHTVDTPGKAHTKYSGEQTITVDKVSATSYRLRETGRGNGINTFNAQNAPETQTTYPSTDFTDTDNDWNNFNAAWDEVATDAHWATEMTYDYFKNVHGRNSVDNAGYKLVNYIHCGTKWFNANWNGSFMRYGDGPNGMPLTAIDIGAHEMTHGVTSNSANLTYQAESGALNESFSDIFGTCVEWMAKPAKADWDMGADIGALRSLQYPKSHSNPDTYQGVYWADITDLSTTGDNGGVHTNSGVQNHWFFILTVGEQGVNDKNANYSVKGIGMESAAKIAFKTLTVYLTNNSKYADARTYSLKSAADIFGSCSQEYISTAYAWDAVNVTGTLSCNVAPTAGFNSTVSDICNGSIQFKDLSSGKPTSWAWDFGDGQTSTTQNPAHTYTVSGTYTVKLTATNATGGNTETKTAYVKITLPTGPTVTPAQRCGPGIVDLKAASTNKGTITWYSGSNGGSPLSTGNTYSPNLSSTTTFYAENTLDVNAQKVGAVDSTSLARGGMFTANYIHGLYFDVLAPLTIKSVKVYAGSAGSRTIDIVDIHGEPVLTTTVNIPKGESRVILNFNLQEGTQYFMKVSGTLLDLQRAKGGASYPYTIANLISITETDVKSTAPNSYYFFYDWEVARIGCASPRTPVTGTINPALTKPTIKETNKVLSVPSGYATYQWYYEGNMINGATTQSYTPTKDGNYTVIVTTDGVGCSATSEIYPFKTDGIAVNYLDALTTIYPNPANEVLFVQAPVSSNVINVSVYSVIGKLIYQETYSNTGQAHAVNLDALTANGIFFIQLQSGSETTTKKFNVNR